MCLDENEEQVSSELSSVPLALTAADYASSIQRSDDDDGRGGFSRHSLIDAVAINLAERSPRFEDPSGHANVTVQLGDTAFLNCRVLDLQDKTVKSHICFATKQLYVPVPIAIVLKHGWFLFF